MAADWMRGSVAWGTLLRLAARNVGRNRIRSALSLAAIAVGVAGLILSGGFVNDIIFQLGEALIHSQSGHVQIARPGYFASGSRSPGKHLIPEAEARTAQIATLPHVKALMRRVGFSALLSTGRSSYPVLGEGIEAEPEALLGTSLVMLEGRPLAAKDRFGALVGAGVARAMDLRPGSPITLVAPTVDEAMNTVELEVTGIFQSFSKDYDERVIKLPLQTAQELLDTRGVNAIVVLLDETRHTAAVARVLAERAAGAGLEVKTWDWLNDFYWKAVALYDRQFGVLRLIVLLMVLLAVVGAINVGVMERAGEFGTMRALGNRGWDVLRLVLLEGLLLGVLGAVLGVALGCGVAWLASTIGIPMPPPPNSNLAFTAAIRLDLFVIAFLIGLSATVLASLGPAVRVARLPVVQALRQMV
jgi:putative ABC transport system permease protein